jgi:hypothetical protein
MIMSRILTDKISLFRHTRVNSAFAKLVKIGSVKRPLIFEHLASKADLVTLER